MYSKLIQTEKQYKPLFDHNLRPLPLLVGELEVDKHHVILNHRQRPGVCFVDTFGFL